jgi:hypothetical protein
MDDQSLELSPEQKKFEDQLKWEQSEMDRITKANPNVKVIMLKIPKNDQYTEFTYGWLRYPSRQYISIAMTMKDSDPLKGKQIVIENSWIEGDRKIIDDDELFLSACTVLDEVIGVRQALVKKNWTSGQ